MTLEEQADYLATQEYLRSGYFGGKKPYGSKNIKYFDFQATKQKFLDQLNKREVK